MNQHIGTGDIIIVEVDHFGDTHTGRIHGSNGDIIPEDVEYVAVEKTDGRIIEIQGGGFQPFILFGKKKLPDILTGKVSRGFLHIVKEIKNIVFVTIDRTFPEVSDFSSLLKL